MSSQDYDMVYALNSYLWKVLEANLGWDKADYGNRPPIIPANQVTELTQFNKPFIVYGSVIQPEVVPYMETEVVAYTIYGSTATEVNDVMRVMVDAFYGVDESARQVNRWLTVEGTTRTNGPRKVLFKSIRLNNATSSGPEKQEGGRSDAQVMVTVQYHTHTETIVSVDDFLP